MFCHHRDIPGSVSERRIQQIVQQLRDSVEILCNRPSFKVLRLRGEKRLSSWIRIHARLVGMCSPTESALAKPSKAVEIERRLFVHNAGALYARFMLSVRVA